MEAHFLVGYLFVGLILMKLPPPPTLIVGEVWYSMVAQYNPDGHRSSFYVRGTTIESSCQRFFRLEFCVSTTYFLFSLLLCVLL
jgi:hypothetical protein